MLTGSRQQRTHQQLQQLLLFSQHSTNLNQGTQTDC